jgi:hypothetical protein
MPLPPLEAWVCPICGIIGENELVQGVSDSAKTPVEPDGYTERYYCMRHVPETPEASWCRLIVVGRGSECT